MKKALSAAWRWIKAHTPSLATRILVVFLPLFALLNFLAQKMAGGLRDVPDLIAATLEIGPRSIAVIAGIGLTIGLAKGLTWDLPNSWRHQCQEVLLGHREGSAVGAFLILAGEFVAIAYLLHTILSALIRWQG